jgi:gamma-glutamylcyclotransferase (GGCT)/AIG2-like uncharacterized protein YtfP
MGRSKRSKNKKSNNPYNIVKQEKALLKQEQRKLKRNEKNKQRHMDDKVLVAVYDNFRFSGDKHSFIEDCEMLGTFESLPKYRLSVLGHNNNNYHEPVLTPGVNSITMEVYKMDDNTLNVMERYIAYTPEAGENMSSYMLKKNIETPWGVAIIYVNNQYGDVTAYIETEDVRSGDWIDWCNTKGEKKVSPIKLN